MENPIKILIVEDQKLLRVGLKTLLDDFDFISVIGEAQNGKEALDFINNNETDVVLMDIGLSDGSGIDFARKIMEKSLNTKIIILTSHMDRQEVLDAFFAKVSAYVIKNINIDSLVVIIKTINEGAIWIDPSAVSIIREKNMQSILKDTQKNGEFKKNHANLTQREYEVLKLIVDGKSNAQIAEALVISEHTAKAHVCNIIQKLVVDDRTQAAVKALKEGLV